MLPRRPLLVVLFIGDLITLALVTVFGFATHGTLGSAGARLLTTFLPLLIGWLAASPALGVYDPRRVLDARQLWRPFWAMILAAPLAAWLRGAWLNAPILPIFVLVLGGFSALGVLGWRAAYILLFARRLTAPKVEHG